MRHYQPMPNHLDFLEALDARTRLSPLGEVSQGYEMHVIAQEAGLVPHGDTSAACWTGELCDLGYVKPRGGLAGQPIPPSHIAWSDRELQSAVGYRVTATGREEADRIRRIRRENRTDATLGLRHPMLELGSLNEIQRQALARPMGELRAALDGGRDAAVLGAAKDLVESACRVVLVRAAETSQGTGSLPTLFTQASRTLLIDPGLGRSLTAAVQHLAELRNAAGVGHGRAVDRTVSHPQARLAAAAAAAIAEFLLVEGEAADLPPTRS